VFEFKLLPADITREKILLDSLFKGGNELEFKFIYLAIYIYILKEIKIHFERIQYKDNLRLSFKECYLELMMVN